MSTNLDINAIRKRLQTLKTQTKKGRSTWQPKPGKTKIRIVPYKFQPGNPFIELYFHYETTKGKLSLKTFGEKDPIVEFAEKLKRTGDKADWQMGRKMEPKLRTFVTMVERGKEKEGVQFWGFGKTIYEKLLTTIAEPEWGDITDPHSGRDIIVDFKTKEEVGGDFPETDIQVLPSQVPLTGDDELLAQLLDNQKEISEVFPKPTYEELVELLEIYLNPPEAKDASSETPKSEVVKEGAKKPPVKEGKQDVGEAFAVMFKQAENAK